MSSDPLENLVDLGVLDRVPGSQQEFDNLALRGKSLHSDSMNINLTITGRFALAYSASHSLCTAALRWYGYKPDDNRYSAFQTVAHTLDLNECVPILEQAHRRRGNIEYDAEPFDDEPFLNALIEENKKLVIRIDELGPVQ